ncbi:hypothetical protein ACFQ68_16500 [Amycolatopsis japonica]|uniref:hypothetical protein n=1 Tax=Amycolatopsis japonica TaxID=208439 RepID=UPI003670439D
MRTTWPAGCGNGSCPDGARGQRGTAGRKPREIAAEVRWPRGPAFSHVTGIAPPIGGGFTAQ